MVNLQVTSQFADRISEENLIKTGQSVLDFVLENPDVELTIQIDDNTAIQSLNKEFRGIDSPTDVLSFPSEEFNPDSGLEYIGDIMISYPRALVQAQKAGHPVESEVQLLLIHGVLHLLGYDHDTEEAKAEMWRDQKEILDHLGIEIKMLPED